MEPKRIIWGEIGASTWVSSERIRNIILSSFRYSFNKDYSSQRYSLIGWISFDNRPLFVEDN
jgi:hypothetical protein